MLFSNVITLFEHRSEGTEMTTLRRSRGCIRHHRIMC